MTVSATLLLSILCEAKELDVRVELGRDPMNISSGATLYPEVLFYFPDRYTVERCSLNNSNENIGEVTFEQVKESLGLRAASLRQSELDRQALEREELLERLNLSEKDKELLGLRPSS